MGGDIALKLTPAVPKPEHIPDELVVDFDLWQDPQLSADPHARFADLAVNAPPIFWSPRQGGAWFASGFEANYEVSRNWEEFTSEVVPYETLRAMNASRPAGTPNIPIAFPINLDPPIHTRFRQPLNRVFSPKAMASISDSIRQLTVQLIDEFAAEKRVEFMSALAEPLPVHVFLKLMGLPLDRKAEYRKLAREFFTGVMAPEEMSRKMQVIAVAMRDTLLARRDKPEDDLISLLWQIEIDGISADLDDVENFSILLFIAGLDTVMQAMGFGILHLAQDPLMQAKLRAQPGSIADAKEELLRRYTFTVPPRTLKRDTVFQGVEMKKGETIWLLLPAADLDPRHWQRPDQVSLDREDKVHIAFGVGPHRCLGSHLARIELQIMYEEMLCRLPSFQVDHERPPTFHGGSVIGIDTLHLTWS